MSRVEELYVKAENAFRRGNDAGWEAAEAMAELVLRGETQRQIGERLGCNHSTVSRYVAAWNHVTTRMLGAACTKDKPPLSEVMAELNAAHAQNRVTLPKAPEQRAELVAQLLEDKAVADAPVVREVEARHATRRIRQEAATFNREHAIPTRAQREYDYRRTSELENRAFWNRVLGELALATRLLNEASGELDRSGLPRSSSGEVIRATRALARAAERFEEKVTGAGIGKPLAANR